MDTRSTVVLRIMLLAVTAMITRPALGSAQYATYLKLDGMEGGSVAKGYEKQIDLIGHGMEKAGACFRFTAVKRLDVATPRLMLLAATGQHVPKGRITVVRPTATAATVIFAIDLENVRIEQLRGDPTVGATSEQVTLTPVKWTATYYPVNPDGTRGSPIVGSFSCSSP